VTDVEPSEWKTVYQAQGWTMLDVRPQEEVDRAAVSGSVHVPLYVTDDDRSVAGLIKQATNTFAGFGWWIGGAHMKLNTSFMADVQAKVPNKNTKIVVACQKGLRSLKACEQLAQAGYTNVAWLSGGYDAAKKGEFDTSNGKDIRYGSAAGVQGLIGWTKVQQEEDRALGGGVMKVLTYVGIFAVVNILSICWQVWGEYSVTGKLPSGLPRIF
jgi:rhodanese-related sulfurtransferase